jgi:hypothetical protein
MTYKASYKVTFRNGAEWVTTVRHLDDPSESAAIRHGRRILRKIFPGAKSIRHRNLWRTAK